jgi:recombination associated protein RdgC
MFFRNLTLFRFSPTVAADLQRLDEALGNFKLRRVGPLELFTRGFVPPVSSDGDSGSLTLNENGCCLATLGGEDKLLPPAVVTDALRRKVQKIADGEGRKVGGRERKRIREDLLMELLPRAFVRSTRISAYADLDGWLVIDTASRKPAETVLTCWREALGSFPAVPLAPQEPARLLLTAWLSTGKLPTGFSLGDECELRDPATASGAVIRARRQDMDAEEIKEHLRNGKQVFKLGLTFDDRLSFVLGEDLVVHKLRFMDAVLDQLPDQVQDAQKEATATLFLMTAELDRLLDRLAVIFDLPRPEDDL